MRLALKAAAAACLALVLRDSTVRAALGDALIAVGSRLAPLPLIDQPGEMTTQQRQRGEEQLRDALRALSPTVNRSPAGFMMPPRPTRRDD